MGTLGPWETQTVDTASLPPMNPAAPDYGAAANTPIGGLLMKATASSNGLQGLSCGELNSLSAHFGRSKCAANTAKSQRLGSGGSASIQ
jgi:hypothetical protein